VGIHSTKRLNDGYKGSGVRLQNAIKKHGTEKFVCEHLEFLPSRQAALDRERDIVNEQLLANPLCMNLIPGGTAVSTPIGQAARDRMRIAKLGKQRGAMPEQQKQNISRGKYKPITIDGQVFPSRKDAWTGVKHKMTHREFAEIVRAYAKAH